MRRFPFRENSEPQDALVARGELELRRLAEDDGLPGQTEVVGASHAIAADLFADDEEEGDVVAGDVGGGGRGGEELFGGSDLGGDAGFCVDGAAAPD